MAKIKIEIPKAPSVSPILDDGSHILQGTDTHDFFLLSSSEFSLTINGGAGNDWLMAMDGPFRFDMNMTAAQNTGFGTHTISSIENIMTSSAVGSVTPFQAVGMT